MPIAMRDLLLSGRSAQSSPDGKHWEPSIPVQLDWNWTDAWEVLRGRAIAVRQTTKADLKSTEDQP